MSSSKGSARGLERRLRRLSLRFLRLLNVRSATLDIFLLPDREMRALKARFLRMKTEPNVLAFPEPRRFPHPETKKRYLGEICLNRNILKKSPERAAPLLLHGILHLLGYDHAGLLRARRMEKIEGKTLRKF